MSTATKLTKPKKSKSSKPATTDRALAISAQCNAQNIGDFDAVNAKSFPERCANALVLYILEKLNAIQEAECSGDLDGRNAFPSNLYMLLDDKMNPVSTTRQINRKGTSNNRKGKGKLPLKRGQTVDVVEEVKEVKEADADTATDTATDATTDTDTDADAKPKRKNVTQVQNSAKNWLLFIANRFIYEVYCTVGGKNVNTDEEFAAFVFENVTHDFGTHMTKVVVPAVMLHGHTVRDMPDHKLQSYIRNCCEWLFEDRPNLNERTSRFLVTYIQLMGSQLANTLWHRRGAITPAHIEMTVRLINEMGTDAYLVEHTACDTGDFNFGMSTGILKLARDFDMALNPPASDAVKAERANKAAKTKAAKAKTKTKSKPKPKPEPEPEPESEAESDDEVEVKAEAEAESESESGDVESESESEADAESGSEVSDDEPEPKTKSKPKKAVKGLRRR